ncbi:helix-turn-helix domain-containing protein [Plantactinospora sp. S1510]|uniref:Helix-turn-helix domain-containing protein n=1 Tax=Plantactinospora alkalitolerans TaxID=2789879 RepID=A0ABS0GPE6_9ACTN|nr:helix-turn-helix domain-containing protein [Plantactinospora alkalitolerans]MBF9127868.1 helix-turn-helix domain-containing protein [Plantactinospora alkalitolerans]
MYRERMSGLAGATVWTVTRAAGTGPGRILPDGCTDLIWSSRRGLLVAGPDTVAKFADGREGARYVGLRFPPGTGPAVFGVPAHELRDQRVALADLWSGAVVAELTERMALSDRPGRLLESVASERLAATGGPDPLAANVVAGLFAGRDVADAAAALGLGTRQLHRRSLALFGYGPKTLARILRMRRALALARAGTPAAEVAVRTGYADQAHLSREVKSLAGVPLRGLVGRPG